MKKFLRAMRDSFGFVPIVFACLILFNYFFGWDRMFKGQMSPPNPFFAAALIASGILWTLWFQRRTR